MPRQKEADTRRLDINAALLNAAKEAWAKKHPEGVAEFRAVLDDAVATYGQFVADSLREIGFTKRENQARQRPVTPATWELLEQLTGENSDDPAKKLDVSKVTIIRCCLELMAREAKG